MFWIGIIAAVTLAAIYIFILRPMLMTQPALSAAFKAEATFLQKMQAKLTGWRTKIAARLIGIAGLVVGLYDQLLPYVLGQNWDPVTSKLPGWALPVGMVAVYWLFDRLRKMTDNPPVVITQKDDAGVAKVVAVLPPAAPAPDAATKAA